jgi:threonine dehydratase
MRLLCKLETLNPVRSFKGRGADYYVHQLAGSVRRLVCASAGNFGQALAYAARRRELAVDVFAAEQASRVKVERMRQLGANVRLVGRDFDEAKAAARDFAAQAGARFVEDGEDVAIAEGAGTLGLELARGRERFDAVLVPLGNGALASGVALAIKALRPATQVIGVCADGAPAMAEAWRSGVVRASPSVNTIADGIAVRVPIASAIADLRELLDDVVVVDDGALVSAMRLALDHVGVVVEPAGVAGLAAALTLRARLAGLTVAVPLCGGNLNPEQARQWLLARSEAVPHDAA